MYAVVGCPECRALWIVEGRPETTECPSCGRRHRFGTLRTFAETDGAAAARRVRASMLADRADGEFVDPGDVDVESVGMDGAAFLSAAGVDAEAAEAAGDRADRGAGRSRSRREVVLDALAELESPTREAICERAAAAGVEASYVDRALQKLRRNGEVTESEGVYRRL